MAYSYSVNNAPATGADLWFEFIACLTTAGWTLPSWSDGVTVHVSGSPTVANLKVLHSWFRLRSPADPNTGQNREFIVQNGQGGAGPYYYWEMKYSPVAGFTTASPSPAVNVPTASDELPWPGFVGTGIIGSSSSTGNFRDFFDNDGTYKMHMVCGDASANYSWAMIVVQNSTTTVRGMWFLDIPNPFQGSSDLDCSIRFMQIFASGMPSTNTNANACIGVSGPGPLVAATTSNMFPASQNPVFMYAMGYGTFPIGSWSSTYPVGYGLWYTVYDNSYNVGGNNRGTGIRGWSRLFLFDFQNTAKTPMDLFSVVNPGDYLVFGSSGTHWLMPWPTGVAVVS